MTIPSIPHRAFLLPLLFACFFAQAKEDAIRCANLVYASSHTSRCFSDEFLSVVQRETAVPTERRFRAVKLASDELFEFPFVVMTGEKEFALSSRERKNLRKYLESGGFLLASAGCSNKEWDKAFRRSISRVFEGEKKLERLNGEHPIYSTFYKIDELLLSKPGKTKPYLEGVSHDGRIVVVYSKEGLNDTAHTEGCCCCGGNELKNSMQVNVNILLYALVH